MDIGWRDPAFAAGGERARKAIAGHWPAGGAVIPCLPIRIASDALPCVLNATPGDEIVMSGVNIAGMAEIVAAHGFTIRRSTSMLILSHQLGKRWPVPCSTGRD
jgi:hypothetical protein